MIPKIAHQTAKTKHLDRREHKLHKKMKKILYDWEIILWDDDDNLRMVKGHFPVYIDSFNDLPHGVMKADIARCMYMALYGGFYFDTDYEILRYFCNDLLNHSCILPKSRESKDSDNESGFIRIGNAVFGSEPGYPIWRDLLTAFFSDPNVRIARVKDIEAISGPEFITAFYLRYAHRYPDIYLPDRIVFHPPKTRNPFADRSRSYGIHHCFGSWRDTSFQTRARKLFSRATTPIGLR